MSKITKDLLQTLRADVNAALAEVAKKHGIVIKTGKGTYGPNGSFGTLQLDLNAITADGIIETAESSRYVKFASHIGCKPEWLNQTFKYAGQDFRLTGLKYTIDAKTPLIATRLSSGKSYLLATAEVIKGFTA